MKVFRTILVAGAALAAITSGATAATTESGFAAAFAQCDSTVSIPGLPDASAFDCGTEPSRLDLANVNLGEADGNFFSLGLSKTGDDFGGGAAFQLKTGFTGPSMVVEVTNANSNHFEAADIFVGNSLLELIAKAQIGDRVGRVNNQTAKSTIEYSGIYSWIGFRDASYALFGKSGNGTRDGFDLDSFTVTDAAPVPLPAGGLLLLSGLGGIAAWRKRRG